MKNGTYLEASNSFVMEKNTKRRKIGYGRFLALRHAARYVTSLPVHITLAC